MLFDAFAGPGVDEFLTELSSDGQQGAVENRPVQTARVLREVVTKGLDQLALSLADTPRLGSRDVGCYDRWHAADHGVALKPVAGLLVRGWRERPPRRPVRERAE
jgi:hypothetical protein